MKIEAIRKFHFCAGHRVYKHESKCANIHGHNYVLWVYAEAPDLDPLGRVVDFSELFGKIDPWLQENWDHTLLYYEEDPEMKALEKVAPKNRPWYSCSFNPTAENMGKYLINEIIPSLLSGTGASVKRLELFETENCKVVVLKD